MRSGCGCAKREGRMCSGQFDVDYVKDVRLSFRALSNSEMDMAIMGLFLTLVRPLVPLIGTPHTRRGECTRSTTTRENLCAVGCFNSCMGSARRSCTISPRPLARMD